MQVVEQVDECEYESEADFNVRLCFESASSSMVHVCISIFAATNGKLVVEVQRRQGCCLGFASFYRTL